MKINKEGYKIITIACICFITILVLGLVFLPLVWGSLLAAFCLVKMFFIIRFFREPKRELLTDESLVYSSCDGKVVAIEKVFEDEYLKCECMQISVFMSVYNVHVNWYPVSGVVEYFKHHHGKFLVAWHPKSSTENERTTTVVTTDKGKKILFRQIAGFVARRIVSYVKVGERAEQNTKFGFIKFGSRIDFFLPLDSEILVNIDDKVRGTQTPLAKIN
ncbi:MAG: phosphatidylserine decarboxylase family protein [Rikenellaceae bacterium]